MLARVHWHHILIAERNIIDSEFYATATVKSLQLCLTLCDPMDCSHPGSSIHGIFKARVLEWVAIAFSTSTNHNILENFIPAETLSVWILFYFFLIFIFTLFYFTILYWFCHTLTWIHHGCTCVPWILKRQREYKM